MDYFPSLPVLDSFAAVLQENGHSNLFEGITFICVQHLLESTGSLIDVLIRLGARPEDILILGKRYSSNSEVLDRLCSMGVQVRDAHRPNRWKEFGKTFDGDVRALWQDLLKTKLKRSIGTVVVLDDGGHCIAHVPELLLKACRVVGIEQTASGLRKIGQSRFPVVNVAASAVKKYIEAPLVAETILHKLEVGMERATTELRVGIIGLGSIGAALAQSLAEKGNKQVFAYDTDSSKMNGWNGSIRYCADLADAFKNADLIFGCTGENLEFTRVLQTVGGKKILVSCSSEDREFHTVVHDYYRRNAGAFSEYEDDIPLKYGPTEVRLLRGGFPINFDHSPESVPNQDIQVTRGLLLGGIAQAVMCQQAHAAVYNLNASLQRFVVETWFRVHPERSKRFDSELLIHLGNLNWIEKESGSTPERCEEISILFSNTESRAHTVTSQS